jgi:hypothetical protein
MTELNPQERTPMTRTSPLSLRWTSTFDARRGTRVLRPVWIRRAA